MKIYTSYFANVKKLEAAGVIPISISCYPPRWFPAGYPRMKELAPTGAMLKMTQEEYDFKFDQILDKLCPSNILEKLAGISKQNGGADVAILCFEKPTDFCHRHVVAKWLNQHPALSDQGSVGQIVEFGQNDTSKLKLPQNILFANISDD